uniref:Integrase n=1 Tax=Steinernema glaseri TaxID=37863 RepID=A0A1I7YBT2_9BILA
MSVIRLRSQRTYAWLLRDETKRQCGFVPKKTGFLLVEAVKDADGLQVAKKKMHKEQWMVKDLIFRWLRNGRK